MLVGRIGSAEAGLIWQDMERTLAKAKRVFEIAKELGVTSKAIVAKCQAESVPGITNHMSTVKLGLAATISEWFGEDQGGGNVATAVETAEKVDLTKVQHPRRKAAKKKKVAQPPADQAEPEAVGLELEVPAVVAGDPAAPETESPVAPLAEAPAEIPPAAAPAPDPVLADVPADVPAVAPEAVPAEAVAGEVIEAVAEAVPAAPEHISPLGMPNVPRRPDVVMPAGEMMSKPDSAVLKGPRVVRIEKADPVSAPPARRSSGPPRRDGGGGNGGGDGGGFDPSTPGIARSKGPSRGRGAGAPGAVGDREGPGRTNKRRFQSTRRGRTAESVPLTRGQMSEQDLIELDARLRGAPGYLKQRRRSMRGGGQAQAALSPAVAGGKVEIEEPITIKALSAATGIKSADIIKYLFTKGVMATINSAIETEAAMEVAMEYTIELEVKEQRTAEQEVVQGFDTRDVVDQRPRPPVVTVLGHVDHGKTSLLDRIRATDVADHEAGGITQHVGAYRVTVRGTDGDDKTVVFLDTPGHAAFTSMRARGASMTDLVVLVVAADDGVMPQTVESINHAKAAGVPIVVALNKIDTPQATEENIRRIYGQLAEHGLNPVEWGGQTEIVKTSAEKGTGITDLVEVLDYQAELLELQADFGGAARGVVIESATQIGRGAVARVLVQDGQLKLGDFIVVGRAFGRVRGMTDDRGRALTEAGPATPLELSGIDLIPDSGDKFYSTDTLRRAETMAQQFRDSERHRQLAASQVKVTLDNFAATVEAGETKELRVVLKADVHGSIDVLRKSLSEQGNKEVTVKVIHAGVGGITESDVLLADASGAIIVGFHVVAPASVRDIAEARRVDIRLYRVIYEVIDEVRQALEGMLAPETKEDSLGVAEVREVFRISKIGHVAGCLVTEGAIQRTGRMRVIRDDVVVTEGRRIDSLRRVKEDVREVRVGTECGIRIVDFDDLKPGDRLACYSVQTISRKLS